MVPALVAFVLLALVAGLAVLLSLIYGPFIAALGLTGAFMVPLLVDTGNPSAFGLFGYLLIVATGALALVRYRGWWWLAWVTLVFSGLWALAWLVEPHHQIDPPVIGLYLVLLAGEFFYATLMRQGAGAPAGGFSRATLVWGAAALPGWLLLVLADSDGHAGTTLLALAALMGLLIAAGRLRPAFDRLAWVGGVLAVLLVTGWELNLSPPAAPPGALIASWPMLPAAAEPLAWVATGFALLLAAAGFTLQWRAPRPGRWAVLAAIAPIALIAAAYWRLTGAGLALPWTLMGLGLAAAELVAAWRSATRRDSPGMEAALAAYAIGVVAAITLAATMSLHEAWLTVALAVQLPVIAWVAEATRVPVLRRVALCLAGAVLVRLLLNPAIFDYPASGLFFNWLLYGYGVPCLAFGLAAWLFARRADDVLVLVLEGGAIALGLALVTLEIHQLLGDGRLDNPDYGLAEQGVQAAAWLVAANLLLYRAGGSDRPALRWGWRIVAGLAALEIFAFPLTTTNPLFTGESVGAGGFFNLVILAYGVPAALAALVHYQAQRQGERGAAAIAGGAALLLGFVALSLELRQHFHGAVLAHGGVGTAESYAYSLGWLVYGGALLGFGIWRRLRALRLAGLGIITLTVAKVFLSDMSNLTGLYRAGSFLALGLCLVGIGFLYQRVVFPAPPPEPEPKP